MAHMLGFSVPQAVDISKTCAAHNTTSAECSVPRFIRTFQWPGASAMNCSQQSESVPSDPICNLDAHHLEVLLVVADSVRFGTQ